MLDAAIEALGIILDPTRFGWMLLGVAFGLIIGVLPALGGLVGLTLLLPFVFGMEPESGLALLVGMMAVTATGDTFTSILIGVPGAGGAQATIMDGYPMARQGKAATALGASFLASMIGGIVGAMALFALIGVARPIILALGSPELFMLTVLGLSAVGVLSRGAPLRGITAGALGLLIGTTGVAPAVAEYRYTFGSTYLFDGLSVALIALGLFAIPEVLGLLSSGKPVAAQAKLSGSLLEGARAVLRAKWLTVRSALIGTGVGMTPGLGGTVSPWIAYASAQQTSRNSEKFGRGDVRGVIAPESANNATEGGALIPTLIFGIPGSASMAILMGGLLLMGVRPGPDLVDRELPLTLSIGWTLVIANVIATAICFLLAAWVAKLTIIPGGILGPFIFVTVVLAAYQTNLDWGDLVVLLVVGLLGIAMKWLGWPRAPMVIGFVLAGPTERYLHLSMSRYGFEWITRPVVIGIGVATLVVIVSAFIAKRPRYSVAAARLQ